jgi:hypothetical protein
MTALRVSSLAVLQSGISKAGTSIASFACIDSATKHKSSRLYSFVATHCASPPVQLNVSDNDAAVVSPCLYRSCAGRASRPTTLRQGEGIERRRLRYRPDH